MRTRSQLVCLVALLPVIAAADSVRAHFLVGAIVEPHLTLTTLAAPERVQVTRADLSKQPADVQAMFDDVARRYDITNDILSLGQDRRWRREVIAAVDP